MLVRTVAPTETRRARKQRVFHTVEVLLMPSMFLTASANGTPPSAGPAVKTADRDVSTSVTVVHRRTRGPRRRR
jgi:hypothetical protein